MYARPAADSPQWVRTGRALAWGQWLAGAFDAVENAGLLILLYHPGAPASPWPQLAAVCASAKFLLLAAGAGFVLLAAPRRAKRRMARLV